MSDVARETEAQRRAAITADLNDTRLPTGSYRPGDHLREHRETDLRSGTDELEAICPAPKPELPIQDAPVIACPHGEADDRFCRICMDRAYGTDAPVIAAAETRKKKAA